MKKIISIIFFMAGLIVFAGDWPWTKYIIVVPSNLVSVANELGRRVNTNLYSSTLPNITNTWSVPLTTNQYGTGIITHYWCNWNMGTSHWRFMTNVGNTVWTSPNVKIFNAATTTPDQVLIDLNLKRYETNGP